MTQSPLCEPLLSIVQGQVNTEWKNLVSLWIGADEQLGAWAYMIALAERRMPTIRTFDKNLHWGNQCGCGIITVDMARSVAAAAAAQGDDSPFGADLPFAQFQLTPFACTRHSIKTLPTYVNGTSVQNPVPFNPPFYNHVEF